MKLNFKDLKQQKFTIDAEESETVADVKQKVAADKGFDAAAIKLIWSGKILQDTTTIGSYEIKATDHIVCMVSKPKAAPVASKGPTTPAPTAAQTPSAPAPSTNAPSENAPATPSPAPATAVPTESSRGSNEQSSMMLGAERQAAIANMESMGFERPQIERAMRAAYYNPDRAVEYLLTGIPASAEQAPAQQRQGGGAAAAAPQTQTPQASQPDPATTTGEADEPVNLFEAAAAANRGGQGAGRGATQSAGAGGGAGAADAAAGTGGEGTGNLEFLRNNPTFLQLRQLVQQNPQMLEQVLQQVAGSNPQLAHLIASQPEAFMNLLMESTEGDDVPLPPGAQSVSVTEAERDAIERLCRLGFERDLVIQAYFACDKNEEMAANFLFDEHDGMGDEARIVCEQWDFKGVADHESYPYSSLTWAVVLNEAPSIHPRQPTGAETAMTTEHGESEVDDAFVHVSGEYARKQSAMCPAHLPPSSHFHVQSKPRNESPSQRY